MIPFISGSSKLLYVILYIIVRGNQPDYLFKELDKLYFLRCKIQTIFFIPV